MSKFGELLRAAADLGPKERLALQSELSVVCDIAWPGSKLRFYARSRTEWGRARKIKEAWTAEWVRSLPPGAVLWDIGANIGVFSLLAAEQRTIRAVLAVEPAPVNYASLVENVLLNDLSDIVQPFACGVGPKTELTWLNLDNLTPGGALHSFGATLELPDRPPALGAKLACLSYRIDDLAAMQGTPFPTHMKIDIDSFELEALSGAPQTLRDDRLRGLQVEVVDWDLSRPVAQRVTSIVESAGFVLERVVDHASTQPVVADLQFIRR